MKYDFTVNKDLNAILGTSFLREIHEYDSGENGAQSRGAMLSLFGEPLFTSQDAENAYQYIIIATDKAENTCTLSVYQDHIGGGKPSEDENIINEAADELAELICKTKPADFNAVIYYEDTDTRIEYGCNNGIPYYRFDDKVSFSYEEGIHLHDQNFETSLQTEGTQELLDSLCYEAQKNLMFLSMPVDFRFSNLNTLNDKKKCNVTLSEHIPEYFYVNQYNITSEQLKIKLEKSKNYDINTSIEIEFNELVWNIECTYVILHKQYSSEVVYRCICEEDVDVYGAFENIVYLVQYLEKYVEDKYISKCILKKREIQDTFVAHNNMSKKLRHFCQNTEIGLFMLSMSNNISSVENVSNNSKNSENLKLSKYIPHYFTENQYTLKIFDDVAVRLQRRGEPSISIEVSLAEEVGLFLSVYYIQYKHTSSSIAGCSVVVGGEDDIIKAFENLVFMTKHLEKFVEEELCLW